MSTITSQTKEVTIYNVAGKAFLTEEEAKTYEKDRTQQLGYTYHVIRYNPENPRRVKPEDKENLYANTVVYAVPKPYTPSNLIIDICIKQFGDPVTRIENSLINTWVIAVSKRFYSIQTLEEFFSEHDVIYFVDAYGEIQESLNQNKR